MTEQLAIPSQERTVEEVIAQVKKIQEVVQAVMKEGEHFGVIPGTNKPTLLKPGAEKLCLTFRLDPQYETTESYNGRHLTIVSRCTLWHIPSGQRMGSGMGSCSTKESKYAWRESRRACPKCGAETIIKGKEEFGGGWLCWSKRGGCGAKFEDGDSAITGQVIGRVPNDDLEDSYNTVLKMSNKRSLVAAVLNVTAASDLFTQDLEDYAVPSSSAKDISAKDTVAKPSAVTPEEAPPHPAEEPVPGDQGVRADGTQAETLASIRNVLLGRIKGVADKMGMKAAQRAALWQKHCQRATPETADPAALNDLYAELVALIGKT